jgi:superfamily I DNA/RNA helicase
MDDISLDFTRIPKKRPVLIEEQEEVIRCQAPNICVKAGPATGKTRVLEAFIWELLDRDIDPDDILPFTFTTTARDVLKGRLEGTQVRAYTIHGHGLKASKAGRKAFLDSGEEPEFSELIRPRQAGEKLYKWVLCDEGQDLTPKQYETFLSWGEHHFLVGDEWQSIFRWANAKPELLSDFSRGFCPRSTFTLKQNHRSLRRIVEISNKFSGRSMGWDTLGGDVRIGSNYPKYLDNVTILARTRDRLLEYNEILLQKNIKHTVVVSKDAGRVATNYESGNSSEVTSPSKYLPTIVMTYHCAKGDEWENVLLDSFFIPQIHSPDYVEAESIFYVGLTRARKKLYIRTNYENYSFINRLLV